MQIFHNEVNVPFPSVQFSKDSGREITETKLRVVYVSPPAPPSPINESAEEGLSPKAVEPESHSNAHFFAEVRLAVPFLGFVLVSTADALAA